LCGHVSHQRHVAFNRRSVFASAASLSFVGAQRFYGRREVKDIIAFLRLVHNPADEASLDRIINVPPRGIGEKTLTTLHMIARQNETSPGNFAH
jgi:superfamily I DNA/RNA helicase